MKVIFSLIIVLTLAMSGCTGPGDFFSEDEPEEVPFEYDLTIEDMIPDEKVVITISHLGYVKRTPLSEYRIQNRGGVGHRGVTTRDNDFVEHIFVDLSVIDNVSLTL